MSKEHSVRSDTTRTTRRRALRLAGAAALGAAALATTAPPAVAEPVRSSAAAGPGPFYWIVSVNSGKALMPYNHSKTPGTDIVQATKGNYGAQHWKVMGSGTARRLQNRHSKHCIIIGVNGYYRVRQDLCQDPPGGAGYPRTTWRSSNYDAMWAGNPITWQNAYSGKCMEIYGGSQAENQIAQQATCTGAYKQQFRLVYVPGT